MNRRLDELFESIEVVKRPVCSGLVFRGYSSMFYDSTTKRVEKKEGFRLLRKKSCKGGELCDSYDGRDFNSIRCDQWMLDELGEFVVMGEGVIFPDQIEDGKLYSLRMTNVTTDFETGYTDGWDFEFYKIEDQDNEGN